MGRSEPSSEFSQFQLGPLAPALTTSSNPTPQQHSHTKGSPRIPPLLLHGHTHTPQLTHYLLCQLLQLLDIGRDERVQVLKDLFYLQG